MYFQKFFMLKCAFAAGVPPYLDLELPQTPIADGEGQRALPKNCTPVLGLQPSALIFGHLGLSPPLQTPIFTRDSRNCYSAS